MCARVMRPCVHKCVVTAPCALHHKSPLQLLLVADADQEAAGQLTAGAGRFGGEKVHMSSDRYRL